MCRNQRELHAMPARHTAFEPLTYSDRVARYEQLRQPSNAHHKILDYHVAEILLCLSTIVAAVIVFLRFHH